MPLSHSSPRFLRYQFHCIANKYLISLGGGLMNHWYLGTCYRTQLAVSSLLLWKECQKSPLPKMTTEWKSVSLYPIPSIIYLIHNNVQFATLTYVDTSTYQIMGNLKIVTTGLLFRCIVFSRVQAQAVPVISLFVLCFVSQLELMPYSYF